MSFKKLALVTAMFAAASGAFAMEALDEEALAATTGQDGITVGITVSATGITMNQIIHDKDGYAAGLDGGAIVIGNVGTSTTPNGGMKIVRDTNLALAGIQAGTLDVSLTIDAASTVATGANPYLNIGVGLQSGMTISTGDLRVASSAASAAGGGIGSITQGDFFSPVIMNSMDIVLGATTMNIQLGNEPQGAMIKLNTNMVGGLTINNFSLNDASVGGGSIAMASQHIYDAGGTDLAVVADIDVTATGLTVALGQFGHATNGASIDMTGVKLGAGTNAALGDIEIRGLNLNGTTLTIAGH